jgi:hypothetical protein
MHGELSAITLAVGFLGELWYVSAGLVLIFLVLLRRAISVDKEATVSATRPLLTLLVWPLAAIVAGLLFTNVDDSRLLTLVLMGAVGTLFVANASLALRALLRSRSQWALVGAGVLLELWLSLAVTFSSIVTISGIGRHWL